MPAALRLSFALALLFFGWLAPGYASKCWGPSLNAFFRDAPVLAGFIGEGSLIVLLAVPGVKTTADDRPRRCLWSSFSTRVFALLIPFTVLVCFVHIGWFASFPRTDVATNAVLWNSDTVTTPLIAAVFSATLPSKSAVLGGALGLFGVLLSTENSGSEDTILGCALCFFASLGYALNIVLVDIVRTREPNLLSVTQWLGIEGLFATVAMACAVGVTAIWDHSLLAQWVAMLPEAQWLALLGATTVALNVGWLWCTELAGASWTAMAACMSIPLSMALDYWLLNVVPSFWAYIGATLVLLGFVVVSLPSNTMENLYRLFGPVRGERGDDLANPLLQCEEPGLVSSAVSEGLEKRSGLQASVADCSNSDLSTDDRDSAQEDLLSVVDSEGQP